MLVVVAVVGFIAVIVIVVVVVVIVVVMVGGVIVVESLSSRRRVVVEVVVVEVVVIVVVESMVFEYSSAVGVRRFEETNTIEHSKADDGHSRGLASHEAFWSKVEVNSRGNLLFRRFDNLQPTTGVIFAWCSPPKDCEYSTRGRGTVTRLNAVPALSAVELAASVANVITAR